MKKFLIAAVAVATLTGAAGAASAAPGYGSNTINNKQSLVSSRIVAGERAGKITVREGRVLRAELAEISRQERMFRASRGLDQREFSILNVRIDNLQAKVIRQTQNREAYAYGYGKDRNDRYDGYGRR